MEILDSILVDQLTVGIFIIMLFGGFWSMVAFHSLRGEKTTEMQLAITGLVGVFTTQVLVKYYWEISAVVVSVIDYKIL